jgi:hypothetical protein
MLTYSSIGRQIGECQERASQRDYGECQEAL